MKNSEYWKNRFKQLEEAQNHYSQKAYTEIEQLYQTAQRQVEKDIRAWYQRFADNNQISLSEARQWISGNALKEFKWDVQEYIKYGKDNAVSGQWMKQLENVSAKFHISKLEMLKIQTQQSMEELFMKQHSIVNNTMLDVFKSGYYHTAYELQRGFNVGWDISGLNQSYVEKLLSKPWAADKYNFSDRIWSSKDKLINSIYTELTQNIMLGEDPQKAIDALSKQMATSKYNAGRLIQTEQAYFSQLAQGECFSALGVEKYEIVEALDSHTCDICGAYDGQVFDMTDYSPGVTAPPWHPNCRGTTCPYFDDKFDIGKRAARDENGNTYYVPDNMAYKEWKSVFVDGGDKSELEESEQYGVKNYSRKYIDTLMYILPDIKNIKTNDDIEAFAEKLIYGLGVNRTNISINVSKIPDFGNCRFSAATTRDIIHYYEYNLNSNDKRSIEHRIRTAFHESFHLSAEGLKWDGMTRSGYLSKVWVDLEETFTESSAHYLLEKYGIKNRLAPSYAEKLVKNLPRLKQLEKYASCATIQDFGKTAFEDRQSGVGAVWSKLSEQMKKVKLKNDYYQQYYSYITEHEDELFDMMYGNTPNYASYRDDMKIELKSAMTKNQKDMSPNEEYVFYSIMACAMQMVGVK